MAVKMSDRSVTDATVDPMLDVAYVEAFVDELGLRLIWEDVRDPRH